MNCPKCNAFFSRQQLFLTLKTYRCKACNCKLTVKVTIWRLLWHYVMIVVVFSVILGMLQASGMWADLGVPQAVQTAVLFTLTFYTSAKVQEVVE